MRLPAFRREVWRNLTTGTSRAGLFASVSVIVLGLIVLAEVVTIAGLVSAGVEYRASGAAITTLTLPGRIDGRACENLNRSAGVIAAGAMREAGGVSLTVLPGTPLDQYLSTPSFPRVLGASDRGRGAYFSMEVVDAVGRRPLAIDGRLVPVRGEFPYPSDGRRAGFGWAMLSPTTEAGGPFDECWVEVWPEREDTRQMLLTTLTPDALGADGDEPQVAQLTSRYGSEFGGAAVYEQRATRFAGTVAFALGGVLAAIAVRLRRVEIASSLHAGAARKTLTLQHVIEVLAWSVPAAVWAWAAGSSTAALAAPTELAALALRSAHLAAGFALGSVVGVVVGSLLVRERALWSYLKSR